MRDGPRRDAVRQAAISSDTSGDISGDLEAEARSLTQRVRAGELDLEAIRLAAACGHAAAGVVIGRPRPSEGPRVIQREVYELEPYGRDLWTRAAMLAGRRSIPIILAELPDRVFVPACVSYAERRLAGETAERPADLPAEARPAPEDHDAIDALAPLHSEAVESAIGAARLLRELESEEWESVTAPCHVVIACVDAGGPELWDAVRSDLAVWALSEN